MAGQIFHLFILAGIFSLWIGSSASNFFSVAIFFSDKFGWANISLVHPSWNFFSLNWVFSIDFFFVDLLLRRALGSIFSLSKIPFLLAENHVWNCYSFSCKKSFSYLQKIHKWWVCVFLNFNLKKAFVK